MLDDTIKYKCMRAPTPLYEWVTFCDNGLVYFGTVTRYNFVWYVNGAQNAEVVHLICTKSAEGFRSGQDPFKNLAWVA